MDLIVTHLQNLSDMNIDEQNCGEMFTNEKEFYQDSFTVEISILSINILILILMLLFGYYVNYVIRPQYVYRINFLVIFLLLTVLSKSI